MNPAVDAVAKAVLYEGYMLYPYRPSAVKNRQRFNFGVVYPRTYSEANGGTDACSMQTQCLLLAREGTHCVVRIRFLRLVDRSIAKSLAPSCGNPESFSNTNLEAVERLEANGKIYQPWQEAVEEVIELPEIELSALTGNPTHWPILLSARQDKEAIRDEHEKVVGVIRRDRARISGSIELTAERLIPGLYKLGIAISNDSSMTSGHTITRETALTHSLVSAHTILEVRGGEFVSLIDPPAEYRDFAASCHNVGTWPVLVGEEGRRDTMLSSPIILYDYPQIAPESPGDLYDGAEIDEILSLRILTMTDEEKAEVRRSDERARQILERTEALPDEHFIKLHGALRGLRPVEKSVGQCESSSGTRSCAAEEMS